ncbi:RNA polymerase sigma factor [Aureibacter tunicatorum]|uniref:RNA polymerase sigma-70 factor (ECF subfamily) n=1 Tax=Aureibacter tunicatorum TaxID=866807 RepID=A0AAE4BTW5_9BACT|nr:RNA polymerase sigma factor [Aureibacter tunicatorum]MDR6240208.1 RNA polymerase sigma-70 factor (ECF subfamily) [Aureibacter tunicatorum]
MEKLEDAYIVEKVKSGDRQLFAYLVNRHKQMVYRLCFRILGSNEEAEECAQDVFVKAYRSLGKFKGDSQFSTWLYRIAYNTSLTRLDKIKRKSFEALETNQMAESVEPEGYMNLCHEEQKQYLNKALSLLAPEEKVLMELYYFKEMSLKEISEITGKPENNIKVKIHRSRAKLKASMLQSLKHEIKSLL